ncbi:MAG: 6,7-dimethyl-8-ribityllumazine synthase [Candidatus Dormibacteria bacterium]
MAPSRGAGTPGADLGAGSGENRRFAVVASRFNQEVTDRLLDSCRRALIEHGTDPEELVVRWVPGALELGVVARRLAVSERYDAVICLGAVIRGETYHFEMVCQAAFSAMTEVALRSGVPVIAGLLTTDNLEQALARAGGSAGDKGRDAALTALEMASVMEEVRRDQEPRETGFRYRSSGS